MNMKRDISILVLSLLLITGGFTIVFGSETGKSPNFEVTITSPEEGEPFQDDEEITIEYMIENTGEVSGEQEVVLSMNGEVVNKTETHIESGLTTEISYTTKYDSGYWSDQFTIEEVRLDSLIAPDTVELGEEFEAKGTGHNAHLFPEVYEEALTQDHLDDHRFTIRNDTDEDILVEVPEEDIELIPQENHSDFEAVIPTEDLESEGEYVVQFEVLGEDEDSYTIRSEDLTVTGTGSAVTEVVPDDEGSDFTGYDAKDSDSFEYGLTEIKVATEDDEDTVNITMSEGTDIEVEMIRPESGDRYQKNEEVHIEFEVINPDDRSINVRLMIEDEERIVNKNWTGEEMKDEQTYRANHTWRPEEEGTYNITVTVDGLDITVRYDVETVDVTVVESDDEITGFTSTLLLISSSIAAFVYHKKSNKS